VFSVNLHSSEGNRETPDEIIGQWPQAKAWNWYNELEPVRGCNYLPATAVNTTEMWQADTFDPDAVDRELGWAESAGYNSIRVFLQYIVWRDDPAGMKERIDRFLSIAERHGIKTMLIFFCDCSFAGKEPYPGRQDDPVPGVHNSGWVPSPGLKRVGDRLQWPDLERYVKDITERFGKDRRVLIWDLYNEPGNSNQGEKSLPLVEAVARWVRSCHPVQPLTVGAWTDFEGKMSKRLIELSDIVSFHTYGSAEDLKRVIAICGKYKRPMLCTEWLKRQSGNTFQTFLPVFSRNHIGWYHWGLVAGRTQTYMP